MNKKISSFAKAMSELLFDMRSDDIGGVSLETPTNSVSVPKEFVDEVLNSDEHISGIKCHILNAIGNHLVLNPNDFKNKRNDYRYTPDVYDFAYNMDSYIENLYEETVLTKKLWVCSNCNSSNVQVKAWVDPNNNNNYIGEVSDGEPNDNYCTDCDGHHRLVYSTLKFTAKIEGYQVVGCDNTKHEGDIHPKMDGSFCIYSLEQAKEMIDDDMLWRLQTIWSGDIEEPTFMFEK